MAKKKYRFTERWLARLRPPTDKPQQEYWDATIPGLHVVVSKTGRKVYYIRTQGKRRKLGEVLGEGPVALKKLETGVALTLEDAQRLALEARGNAPRARARSRTRASQVDSVAKLYEIWREHKVPTFSKNSRINYCRAIEHDVLPVFGKLHPEEIDPDDVLDWLESIGEPPPYGRGAPIQANRSKSYFTSMLRWGARRRLISVNKLAGVEWRYEERKKRVVYKSHEIRTLWHDWTSRSGFGVRVFRLVLATMQRPGEVMSMRWDQIDTLDGEVVWVLSDEDTKNDNWHYVPLQSLALEVLDELRPLTGTGKWVFPRANDPDKPMMTYNRVMIDVRERTGIHHFTAHSLRRTGSSWMKTLGVSLPTIQSILNHTPQGATGHYVFAQGASPECREALRMLDGFLRQCIEESVAA